ncbi:30S ribosomal protein S4 [Metallumcola ferriviriculae]|uniref:Small ribosomal subunit protein uS4 n=1 Tax=Metallumcola ferriviriculae TaxID=3039180 RepID=A0AAU0UH46_9FIRM|nr:30S ribosomal protein S4 [Desulfitibacteraceae bacterium MK1]
MARYRDSVCRQCRREGQKLYLKSDRCYSDKCAIGRREYAPGQHGQRRKKVSEYGLQLREKQKTRRIYGVLEKQFRKYFAEAERQKGITGDNLLRLLEKRLDNVVFRLGFAGSRVEARQLVLHGHFKVNGRKVNIPSFLVRLGDEITVKDTSKSSVKFKEIAEAAAHKTPPAWLEADVENFTGKVIALPQREDIDVPVEDHLIVELYSR